MKTEIFVMTHKECLVPDGPGYIRLQVGSELHDDLGYMRDNEGDDHISDLNMYYAELTGLYWLWKNYNDADIIGLCHYRRYFINDEKKPITMDEVEKMLADSDIIVTEAEREKNRTENPMYKAVEEAIKVLYPDDLEAYKESCNNLIGTFGNMLVMRKSDLDKYCEWLFSVLLEAGEHIDLTRCDMYHKKMPAIVAEELLGVYVNSRGLRAKKCKAGLFGEKKETTELKEALKLLMKQDRYAEAFELYNGVMKQRPDLTLPDADPFGELRKIEKELMSKMRKEI